MRLISFNIPNDINPKLFTKHVLNTYELPNDILIHIKEFIYGNNDEKNIKFIYEIKDRKTWDIYYEIVNIDYNLFIFQLSNFILYKYVYFNEKRLTPYLRNDKYFFITEVNHNLINNYYTIFILLYNELYSYFYNETKYECLYYNSYHEINDKCYILLNNYI